MANLLGQNIGTNYKGILNLNTLNGNLSGTLQAVTDGDGNASLLQLSTTEVAIPTGIFTVDAQMRFNGTIYNTIDDIVKFGGAIRTATFASIGGTFTTSARLHVRGDGTNPIARFETSGGTASHIFKDTTALEFGNQGINISATSNGTNKTTSGRGFLFEGVSGQSIYQFNFLASANSETSGTWGGINLTSGVSSGAGSGNLRPLNIAYTINNSGAQTGTATGIFLNATETALNGMGHNLIDLQVGGVSKFKVDRTGFLTTSSAIIVNGYISLPSNASISFSGQSQIFNSSDGVIRLANDAGTSFGRLQFGGTTNAFPAIKRNGAGIEFRLADDSDFTGVSASLFTANYVGSSVVMNLFDTDRQIGTGGAGHIGFKAGSSFTFSNINLNVATTSAIVEITSTTKGFLPPRMTTTEKNAIATPASGLVVYDSTLNKLAVYTGSAWETVTSI
jgi:hypothetical protein